MCGVAFLHSQNMAYRLGLHHLVDGLIGLVHLPRPWLRPRRRSAAGTRVGYGSVFLPSGRMESCREHWCSSAHEGRIDEQEVAIDSRTNGRI
jgi:hypothetical protein